MASNQAANQGSQSQQPNANNPTSVPPCPYHGPILAMIPKKGPNNLSSMERFLSEGPGEQGALFIRADTGKLSFNKGCTCDNNSTMG